MSVCDPDEGMHTLFKGAIATQLITDLPTTPERLKKAIAHADIEVLRRLEDEAGFHERTKSQDRFFGAGKSGGWRDVLSDAQVKRLIDRHRVQMNRFGYVPDGY